MEKRLSSIEDSIDQKTRLSEGIFFTGTHVVQQICAQFDLSKVDSVIDSAAGSCNFLIGLATEYPQKQFYAVERNETIYQSVLPTLKNLPNLHYIQGDILLDDLPIPPCDLYLGNPPFVNYTDLPPDYRERIRPLWKQTMTVSRGFALLLGDSRGDVASLIFYHSVSHYLKEGGQFGVILPNSLIKGNKASAGFREFKGITVERIVDISEQEAFAHTERACFYVLGRKGGETAYPITYEKNNKLIHLSKRGDSLVEGDPLHQEGSDYKVRQGINTLGANGVFFFDEKPPFESELIHPLLRSGDVGENRSNPTRWVLLPYDKEGKILLEDDIKSNYPLAWNYLLSQKDKLVGRKSRFVGKLWYGLFAIGSYTFAPYKVVWRAMGAKKLEAAVVTTAIPNQAMHGYIACESKGEAQYLCDMLNSTEIRRLVEILCEGGSRSFAQPGTMKQLPLKKYSLGV